jgi:alpha-glucosidase
LPFNFRLVFSPWESTVIKKLIQEFNTHLPPNGWPNWVLSNHDQPRFASRAGRENIRNGHLFLLTAQGTPTIYYGDELGMECVHVPYERVQDPWELLSPGLGLGRDPSRTPMLWDNGKNAGFCDPEAEPWLPAGGQQTSMSVSVQKKDEASTLNFIRCVIELRRRHETLRRGKIEVLSDSADYLLYRRYMSGYEKSYLIAINFTNRVVRADLQDFLKRRHTAWNPLVSTSSFPKTPAPIRNGVVELNPYEGLLLESG